MPKGLIHVYTGDGKGKTTAAIGLAVRAYGHGRKVLLLQFLKGASPDSGEIIALKKLGIKVTRFLDQVSPLFDPDVDISRLKESVKKSVETTIREMQSGLNDVVILDEFNNLLGGNLLGMDDVNRIIRAKPDGVELVFTGRNAPGELLDLADYVTQVLMVKHPFENDVKARKGIEF
jgi:cob(I)alamin adenosyltransferase